MKLITTIEFFKDLQNDIRDYMDRHPNATDLYLHETVAEIYLSDAIEALEKQIPKKSIVDFHSAARYRCPNCNSTVNLNIDSPTFPFCSYCGQAIDWSEVEE